MIDLRHGDCASILKEIEPNSVDAIFTDPPYPEIGRAYGKMTTDEWFKLMQTVVKESKRILKDKGSAVFILQPNSEKVGKMRLWLWEFLVWAAKEWNLIQDVYWHNSAALPNVHCQRKYGLMRPSMKFCLWLGPHDCYRNQDEVLIPSKAEKYPNRDNELRYKPSGYNVRDARAINTALERGGSTPFNLIQCSNTYNKKCSGSFGHGAGTPYKLTEWWIKYISKPNDLVVDMFSGAGTTGIVCQESQRRYIGIEKFKEYHDIAVSRLC